MQKSLKVNFKDFYKCSGRIHIERNWGLGLGRTWGSIILAWGFAMALHRLHVLFEFFFFDL